MQHQDLHINIHKYTYVSIISKPDERDISVHRRLQLPFRYGQHHGPTGMHE